jgi:hypothetical protein
MALLELRTHRWFLRQRDTGQAEVAAPAMVRVQCAQNRDFHNASWGRVVVVRKFQLLNSNMWFLF